MYPRPVSPKSSWLLAPVLSCTGMGKAAVCAPPRCNRAYCLRSKSGDLTGGVTEPARRANGCVGLPPCVLRMNDSFAELELILKRAFFLLRCGQPLPGTADCYLDLDEHLFPESARSRVVTTTDCGESAMQLTLVSRSNHPSQLTSLVEQLDATDHGHACSRPDQAVHPTCLGHAVLENACQCTTQRAAELPEGATRRGASEGIADECREPSPNGTPDVAFSQRQAVSPGWNAAPDATLQTAPLPSESLAHSLRVADVTACAPFRSSLHRAIQMGFEIYESLSPAERQGMHLKERKPKSFRALARSRQIPVSTLWRALATYLLYCRYPELERYSHLGVAHVSVILGVADDYQLHFLRKAEVGGWSRRQLERQVKVLYSIARRSGVPAVSSRPLLDQRSASEVG